MVVAAVDWGAITVVVASSAVVSGVVTSLLAGRHERQQHVREQMLDVAASFAADFVKARETVESIPQQRGKATVALSRQVGQARDEIAQLESSYLGRIKVLWGPRSNTVAAAAVALQFLASAVLEAELWTKTDDPEAFDQYQLSLKTAADTSDDFCDRAWQGMKSPVARQEPFLLRAYYATLGRLVAPLLRRVHGSDWSIWGR